MTAVQQMAVKGHSTWSFGSLAQPTCARSRGGPTGRCQAEAQLRRGSTRAGGNAVAGGAAAGAATGAARVAAMATLWRHRLRRCATGASEHTDTTSAAAAAISTHRGGIAGLARPAWAAAAAAAGRAGATGLQQVRGCGGGVCGCGGERRGQRAAVRELQRREADNVLHLHLRRTEYQMRNSQSQAPRVCLLTSAADSSTPAFEAAGCRHCGGGSQGLLTTPDC